MPPTFVKNFIIINIVKGDSAKNKTEVDKLYLNMHSKYFWLRKLQC